MSEAYPERPAPRRAAEAPRRRRTPAGAIVVRGERRNRSRQITIVRQPGGLLPRRAEALGGAGLRTRGPLFAIPGRGRRHERVDQPPRRRGRFVNRAI